MIFLLGGARSGKSTLAVSTATRIGEPVRLIATARADDAEMAERIEAHRRNRPAHWTVVEAPIDLGDAIRDADDGETLVVDCVTLWVSNLMVERDDSTILEMVGSVIDLIGHRSGETIVISNEVGAGVVPMNPVGRRFRDLQGNANQRFAAAADRSYLVVAGKPLRLENEGDVI